LTGSVLRCRSRLVTYRVLAGGVLCGGGGLVADNGVPVVAAGGAIVVVGGSVVVAVVIAKMFVNGVKDCVDKERF